MRDDFMPDVKDILAKRVSMRCSNPNCRQPTSGPQEDPCKVLNIGVAAHITAASVNGPRYDKNLSAQERSSIENGIWLCQNCGKLVDNDARQYPTDLLRRWKQLSEEAALLNIESPGNAGVSDKMTDEDLIRFYAQCFDRPAFQDHFHQEGSMEAFDKAIEDTITALNTGCLRSRDRGILAQGKGKLICGKQNGVTKWTSLGTCCEQFGQGTTALFGRGQFISTATLTAFRTEN